MAPLALQNITEELTNTRDRGLNLQECMTKVYAAAAGSFCAGFSGGVALQVHYARYLPRPVKAFLIIPATLGATAATTVYHHQSNQCLQEWAANLSGEVQQV